MDVYVVVALHIETPLGGSKTARAHQHKRAEKSPLHQGMGAFSCTDCTRGGGPERQHLGDMRDEEI
jgi:hypothetical protein